MAHTNVVVSGTTSLAWDTPHAVSRALVLSVSSSGHLIASGSVASPQTPVTWDALPLLGLFSRPRTCRDVFAEITSSGCRQEEFATAVMALVQANILVPEYAGGPGYRRGLFSSAPQHHTMLKDVTRIMAYRAAIGRLVSGKSVVEVGAGTGLLSIFAAQSGASRVDAIEETGIADVARRMFQANGCDELVTLHVGHSRNVTLPSPADVLVHEIIGVDPLDENILPNIADATRRFLRPGGICIPHRLAICCHAFEVTGNPYSDKDLCLDEAAELDQVYGLHFEPYRATLRDCAPAAFERPLEVGNIATFRPRFLSAESQLLDFDLTELDPLGRVAAVRRQIPITGTGTLGGLLVHFRAALDDRISISNSPFAPPTSWRRGVKSLPRIQVREGDMVTVTVGATTIGGRQRLQIELA